MKGAGMTREEQNRKLKAFITCLKCEVSGKPCDDNCPIQYEAGNMGEIIENLEAISKALEQEPQIFKWCKTCKEYDQEKHCCHRWSKVIRNTVEEMKQEYIEREVLDKIRAELHATAELHDDGDYYLREGWIGEIFDKYKAENNS